MKHIKTYGEFLNEQELNEKKYKLGSGWTKDFDYDGMLNFALTVNRKTPAAIRNKLLADLTDVNYHKEAGLLDYGDFKGFHKEVKNGLDEGLETGNFGRDINESISGSLIVLGLIGVVGYAGKKFNDYVREYALNKKEAAKLKFLYDKYGDLFENDPKIKTLVSKYKKLKSQSDKEQAEQEAENAKDPFKKGDHVWITDMPSADERFRTLTEIGEYVQKKVEAKFGDDEFGKKFNMDKLTTLRNAIINSTNEGIDSDTITKSVDSGAPYVHNIEKGYYGITDNIGELVEWLEAAASDDSDWKEELKIFKQIEKLVDKSKLGKFL